MRTKKRSVKSEKEIKVRNIRADAAFAGEKVTWNLWRWRLIEENSVVLLIESGFERICAKNPPMKE